MPDHPAGSQSLLRSINGRAVLELLATSGALTRADVAHRSGLSKPTVAAVLADLAARRTVVEEGLVTGRKGPAAALYRIAPDAWYALGIDIGTRWLRVALRDASGAVRAEAAEPTPAVLAEIAPTVRDLAGKVAAEAGTTFEDVTATVVGLPGVVGADGRTLSYAGGLPGDGDGLGTALADVLGAGVVLENDINLAAVVEHTTGSARGVDDFVLVGLGTGVGMGVVIGGRLHRGGRGAAGEVGYLPAPHPEPTVRTAPLRRDVVDDVLGSDRIAAVAAAQGLPGRTPREVFDLARTGDPRALAVVDDTARGLAWAVACVVPVLDPSLVVLGGAIGANGDLLVRPVSAHLAGLTTLVPPVVASELGSRATLLGALEQATVLARDRAFTAATTPS